jgi:transketolase
MRNAFADEMTKLGQSDPRVVLLSGDIGNKLFDAYKGAQPERFFNCGVAEQNMTGLATGLAINGFRPFTYTIAPFATTRCLEQIRTDAAYHDAPVTVVAVGAGLAYAGLGPTHHSCEDLAFLRAIPNMLVIAPADSWEVRAALRAVLQQDRPAYIRIGKKGEPVVHAGPLEDFQIGRAITVREGSRVCLLSTGNMLPEAIEAAKRLEAEGVSPQVVSFHTVKPLDEACLSDAFTRFEIVATLEEHSLIGGFGSAVAEWMVDGDVRGARLMRFGAPDSFFKQSGEQHYAREVLGLTGEHIAGRIARTLDPRSIHA